MDIVHDRKFIKGDLVRMVNLDCLELQTEYTKIKVGDEFVVNFNHPFPFVEVMRYEGYKGSKGRKYYIVREYNLEKIGHDPSKLRDEKIEAWFEDPNADL